MEKPKKRSVPMETAMPAVESGFAEVETRAEAPARPADDGGQVVRFRGGLNGYTQCPYCTAIKTEDGCISARIDSTDAARLGVVIRRHFCLWCQRKFKSIEAVAEAPEA